jgi:hypothetical protein
MDVSLSEMVSGYFRAVCKGKTVKIEAAPVLAEISGVLRSKVKPKKLIAGYHITRNKRDYATDISPSHSICDTAIAPVFESC